MLNDNVQCMDLALMIKPLLLDLVVSQTWLMLAQHALVVICL